MNLQETKDYYRKKHLARVEEELNTPSYIMSDEVSEVIRQHKCEKQNLVYKNNPELRKKKIATSNQWRKDNRERYNKLIADWREKNKEKARKNGRDSMRKARIKKKKIKEYRRQYYKDNKEKCLEQNRAWYEANKAKAKEYYEANKAKKKEDSRKNMRNKRLRDKQKYGMSLYMYNKLNKL